MMLKRREATVLAVAILVLLVWIFWPKSQGGTVVITVDGTETGRYAFSQPMETVVDGYGGFHLKLIIQDGEAHVEESTCPDLICQHHAPISAAGEQIICLPGRIVISVIGEEAGIDAITG